LPQFRISQHERDLVLLKRVLLSLGSGTIVKPPLDRNRYEMSITGLSNIKLNIVPFFNKYRLYGAKQLDFISFCEGISIMEKKEHLTEKGVRQIKGLAYSMNSYRKF